jgi:uncharacterized protein YceH (UPF0502 family)
MPQLLSEIEARVIGCLIEKQIATPDQYPLTLHAVVAACNQKSNRHPVMSLAEHDVQAALAALTRRNLVLERFGVGDRVPKYQQLFCNTEFGSLRLSPQQTAIVCELLVRGPQTPGELRSRAARLAEFRAAGEVEAALEDLMTRPDGPYVARLAREPGRREARYVHLFAGEPPTAAAVSAAAADIQPARATRAALDERVAALEQAVSELRDAIAELRALPGRDQ